MGKEVLVAVMLGKRFELICVSLAKCDLETNVSRNEWRDLPGHLDTGYTRSNCGRQCFRGEKNLLASIW